MEDRQLSTAWKVALMWLWSGGAVGSLSSDAHQSQNAANLPKIKIWHWPKMMPSRSMWLKMGTKPVWGTLQLWIFLSCDSNGAIDMFTRRVGRWEVNDFVAALWIFRKCSGVGRTAQIRWGTIDVEIEPRGAESRSILPRYVSKNGTACGSEIAIMWNPLYSHIMTSKTKSSSLSSTSTSKYHFRCRYINKPRTIDGKASNRMVHTHSESLLHPTANRVHNKLKLCGIASFGGQKLSFWKVKITSMREDRDNSRPIIVATHHLRSGMIWDGTMTKSYTVSLQILAIFWVPEYFVEVGAGFWAAATQITNNIMKRHWYTTTAWEGYQKASFGIS